MAQLDGQCIRHKHIVACLIDDLLMILAFFEEDAARCTRHPAHIVDLVEGQPVFHLACIAAKHGLAVSGEKADQLPAAPAAVFLDQIGGSFVMAQRDQWLHSTAKHLVKQIIVILEPFLIGHRIVTVREDARPVNGGAEHFEAHLLHQRKIFLVAVVEVDCFMSGIELSGNKFRVIAVLDPVRKITGH